MPDFARGFFCWLFVPAVVTGIWTYAHLRNVTERNLQIQWQESGGIVVVGNPYTTHLTSTPRTAIECAEAEFADMSIDDLFAPDDYSSP